MLLSYSVVGKKGKLQKAPFTSADASRNSFCLERPKQMSTILHHIPGISDKLVALRCSSRCLRRQPFPLVLFVNLVGVDGKMDGKMEIFCQACMCLLRITPRGINLGIVAVGEQRRSSPWCWSPSPLDTRLIQFLIADYQMLPTCFKNFCISIR
ncbi:hypothetical protein lerEdw1_006151, partial [Lerista edwardsae]